MPFSLDNSIKGIITIDSSVLTCYTHVYYLQSYTYSNIKMYRISIVLTQLYSFSSSSLVFRETVVCVRFQQRRKFISHPVGSKRIVYSVSETIPSKSNVSGRVDVS